MRKTLTAKSGLVVRIGAYRLRVLEVIGPYNIHLSTYRGRAHFLDATVLTELFAGVWGGVVPQPPGKTPLLLIQWSFENKPAVVLEHNNTVNA